MQGNLDVNGSTSARIAALVEKTLFFCGHAAVAATWADKFRDTNRNGARQKTRQWHFVDIKIASPDLDQACFGHPPVPPGTRPPMARSRTALSIRFRNLRQSWPTRQLTLRNRLSPS